VNSALAFNQQNFENRWRSIAGDYWPRAGRTQGLPMPLLFRPARNHLEPIGLKFLDHGQKKSRKANTLAASNRVTTSSRLLARKNDVGAPAIQES